MHRSIYCPGNLPEAKVGCDQKIWGFRFSVVCSPGVEVKPTPDSGVRVGGSNLIPNGTYCPELI